MKTAIIKKSVLVSEDRMDAGFHIALSKVRHRVQELKTSISAEEARAKLDLIPLTDKAPLMLLSRGDRILRERSIDACVQEYPHLSLAIMEENLAPAISRITQKIEDSQKALENLLSLQSAAPGGAK